MDAAEQDPIEMMTELARGMLPERRGRFLDAACGGDQVLRAEVETRLGKPSPGNATAPEPGTAADDEMGTIVSDLRAMDDLALEAVSTDRPLHDQELGDRDTAAPEDASLLCHCDQNRLDAVARIRLFQALCRSIVQEHRHGRIHGGLTPDHVRVGNEGRVHIESRPPTEQDGEFEEPSRLRYTSPEQILGEPATTATDVYGLGMILYELLTGRFPYRISSQDLDALINAISEQAPERPSLATDRPEERPGMAQALYQARQTSPARLRRFLTGDLELILLQALHKEPERRYATAGLLADDLENFLQGRPVEAHRDSRSYRLGKLIQRHPLGSLFALLSAMAILLGLIGTSVALSHSRRELARAGTSAVAARAAIDELLDRIQAEHVLEAPDLQPARTALLESLLRYYETARSQAGTDLPEREKAAEAQMHIAQINRLAGLQDVAAWQYENAMECYEPLIAANPGEPRYRDDTMSILIDLGETLLPRKDQRSQAQGYLERARTLLERDAPSLLSTSARRRERARVLGDLAMMENNEGRFSQARALWKQAIEIGDGLVATKPVSLDDRIALATARMGLGRSMTPVPETLDPGIAALNQGVELRQMIVSEHPERVDQLHQLALEQNELAILYHTIGRLEPALATGTQAVASFEQLDRRFPDSIPCQAGLYLGYDLLTRLLNQRGETALALERARQARSVLERLVVRHPRNSEFSIDLSRSHNFIGRLLRHEGKLDEALRAFQRAVDVLESLPKLDPANSYQLAVNLALCIPLIGSGAGPAILEDDTKLSPADRLRRRIYGTRAVTALEQAVTGGHVNLETLQTDADLDAIRDDYQKLFKSLVDKAKPAT